MRNNRVFFVLILVVAAEVLLLVNSSTHVDCKATIEKIEEEAAAKHGKESGGGSESWAKDKLSEGLGFKSADDQDSSSSSSNSNQLPKDKGGCVKDKAAEEAKKKAAAGEAEDKVDEKVCDIMGKKVAEEGKKRDIGLGER